LPVLSLKSESHLITDPSLSNLFINPLFGSDANHLGLKFEILYDFSSSSILLSFEFFLENKGTGASKISLDFVVRGIINELSLLSKKSFILSLSSVWQSKLR